MREKTALAAITLVSCFFPCPAFLAHSLTPRLLTELRDRQQITERRKPSLLRCAPRGARRSFELRMTDQVPDPKDIFEALMAGDKAGVEAYVNAGGDCGVRDAIGNLNMNMIWLLAENGRVIVDSCTYTMSLPNI